MAHGQHAKATQLFGCVEHYRRETARHFGVETDLDTCLDLVLTLHKQVQELLGIDHSLTEVRHQTDQSSVPFVYNLEVKKKNQNCDITCYSSNVLGEGCLLTLVNVVDPEAIRIWRTLLWKRCIDSSSTRRKHCAVLSFVTYTGKQHMNSDTILVYAFPTNIWELLML